MRDLLQPFIGFLTVSLGFLVGLVLMSLLDQGFSGLLTNALALGGVTIAIILILRLLTSVTNLSPKIKPKAVTQQPLAPVPGTTISNSPKLTEEETLPEDIL